MTIDVLHVGDLYRIEADFTNISGVAVDPSTVSLKVMDPSGNVDEYTYSGGSVSTDGTGSYYKDVSLDEAGDWRAWWSSTGTGQGAEPVQWVVEGYPLP
jgi:hypothetical protein